MTKPDYSITQMMVLLAEAARISAESFETNAMWAAKAGHVGAARRGFQMAASLTELATDDTMQHSMAARTLQVMAGEVKPPHEHRAIESEDKEICPDYGRPIKRDYGGTA